VNLRSEWKRWGVAIVGITIAAFLVSVWLSPRELLAAQIPAGLIASLTYSICIGLLMFAAGHFAWDTGGDRPLGWRMALWVSTSLIAVVAGTLMAYALLHSAGITRSANFWRGYWNSLQFAAFITVTFGAVICVYEYWRGKYKHAELERERAVKLAAEARLASLESRIHPHFLFNTLNSISALIHSNPEAADEQLQRLCSLLRFSLDAPETPLVTLGREMQIVRDYLEIEKTRFGARLRYVIEVPEELLPEQVPPLSVQTLVENSVKYAIGPRREGGEVRVTARREGGRLTIAVADGGPGVSEGQIVAGHGLDLLRGRLEAHFGEAAKLEFSAAAVKMAIGR
jgi:two-component system, LytTR family, sensor histidine kinase AlgZ